MLKDHHECRHVFTGGRGNMQEMDTSFFWFRIPFLVLPCYPAGQTVSRKVSCSWLNHRNLFKLWLQLELDHFDPNSKNIKEINQIKMHNKKKTKTKNKNNSMSREAQHSHEAN